MAKPAPHFPVRPDQGRPPRRRRRRTPL